MAFLVACEENADIIIASEPNRNITKREGWIADENNDVAIYFRNKNIKVKNITRHRGIILARLDKFSIMGCYISPNVDLQIFGRYLDDISELVTLENREMVVAGDFNSKAPEWGSPISDRRGQMLIEACARFRLTAANTGGNPTFIRRQTRSYIDITFLSENLSRQLKFWKVLDNEPLSPHRHILFDITDDQPKRNHIRNKVNFNRNTYTRTLLLELENIEREKIDPMELTAIVKKCSNKSKEISANHQNSVPYWWNEQAAELRKKCLHARREHTRIMQRDPDDETAERSWELYKNAKKLLKKHIRDEKKKHWQALCDDLENDIFGDGFKIAMKSFQRTGTPFNIDDDSKDLIIKTLFPTRNDRLPTWQRPGHINLFSLGELTQATSKLKTGKSPGMDGIPTEAVKELVAVAPDLTLNIMNNLLKRQEFPPCWKMAKLVLIHKPGKPYYDTNGYRPLCIIDVLAKLLEHLVKGRLEAELEDKEGIAQNQYGFRKGKSTVQAVNRVMDIAKRQKFRGYDDVRGERWCALLTLDVRNAFNSAPWVYVLRELKKKRISAYLINLVRDYFSSRYIVHEKMTYRMSVGIPQGSVIGPTLWNVFYDPVLTLEYENGVDTIGFADDLAIVIRAEKKAELIEKTNTALGKINKWMEENGLSLAPEKTEAVILSGRRDRRDIRFEVNGVQITPSKEIKYLGITVGEDINFRAHVTRTTRKATEKLSTLMRLMPNMGGPSDKKRELLYYVVQSTLLYGASIWGQQLRIKKYRLIMESLQRRALLRVARGYRTISTAAIQVLTGIPPMDLIVEERSRVEKAGGREEERTLARESILNTWQDRWNNEEAKGQWTKELIPNINTWIKCTHRSLDYQLTQAMTGHGSFRTYTKRLGKTDDDCIYCGAVDTAEHTIFQCHRWDAVRLTAEAILGTTLTKYNLVPLMTRDRVHWQAVADMIHKIMSSKERDERTNGQGAQ